MSGPGAHGNAAFVPGSLIAGKYRLIKNLGEGAMGVVWSAVNQDTAGEVALKLIWKPEPEYRVRLLREARACGRIVHKNVIRIHDVGQTDAGDPFLVMELLTGETLAELLARKRRLPPAEAAAIGRDIARGLAAAHAKDVIHRDLKPANVFLHNQPGEDLPVVKVLDFGVAKNLAFNDGLRTAMGGAVGSPMYMSPEQASKSPQVTPAADVWSLGVVLFEMLTGDRPFRGEIAEIYHQLLHGDIPTVARRIRRIDPELDAIVAGCMTRDPEERLGPASEVARLLDEHAEPTGRDPLPSLVEEAISDRLSPGSSSSPAGFSPSPGALGLQPTGPAGLGSTGSRLSAGAAGLGSTGSRLSADPAGLGSTGSRLSAGAAVQAPPLTRGSLMEEDADPATQPLDAPPAPWRRPQAPAVDSDDAATRRMAPDAMPRPRASQPDAFAGPTGTVRIDPNVVEAAIAARGQVAPAPAPLPAPPPPAAPSRPWAATASLPGAAVLVPPPSQGISSSVAGAVSSTAPLSPRAPSSGRPPSQGSVSSTAPMIQVDPVAPIPAGSPPRASRRTLLLVAAGFVFGLACIVVAAFFLLRNRELGQSGTAEAAATGMGTAPTAQPTSSAAPSSSASDSGSVAPTPPTGGTLAPAPATATTPLGAGTTTSPVTPPPPKTATPVSPGPKPANTVPKATSTATKPAGCTRFSTDPKCKRDFKGL